MNTIGTRIKYARRRAGMRQHQLAKELGLTSQGAVSNMEVGVSDPPRRTVQALGRILGVHPAWIEYGEGVCPMKKKYFPERTGENEHGDGNDEQPST